MRRSQLCRSFVALLPAAGLMFGQADQLSVISEALKAKYLLTVITADRTEIVRTGSVLNLKKSNLVTANATSLIPMSNTYKGGKITQGIIGQIASGGAGTRTFVTGERLRVTGIDVTSKAITFSLFSDEYSGSHYRATLNFPLAKGSAPSAAEAIAMIGEVFDSDGPAPLVSVAEMNTTSPAPITRAPDNTPWDPRHGRLTSEDVHRINDPTLRFDLNYLRLNPAALDQKPVMQYFIALNNCNDDNVKRALSNELDYPALASFYKTRAAEILAPLPRTVTDVTLYRYIGGTRSGNSMLFSQSLNLGEYDIQRRAFPLKYPGKDSVEISDSLSMQSNSRDFGKSCPAAVEASRAVTAYLPITYAILLKPATYKELPMDQDSARQYIDHASKQRNVFLAVDVTILDDPPTISRADKTINQAAFSVQTARIRVIDGTTLTPLGSLFDDHSLPTEVQVAEAPPPQPAKPTNSFAFDDHMYDIRTAVYISLSSEACSWPLTTDQSANLRRFVEQMSTRGNFNEKYQYSLAEAQIRRNINANGRRNFCANPAERRNFDKTAATVAPLGPLAAPLSK